MASRLGLSARSLEGHLTASVEFGDGEESVFWAVALMSATPLDVDVDEDGRAYDALAARYLNVEFG